MNSKIFTDNQLAQMFLEMQKDFTTKQGEGQSVHDISQYLGERLHWSLQNGHLKDLYPEEKQKAYQVLNTVIQSMPEYQKLSAEDKRIEIPRTFTRENHHHHHGYYCNNRDPLLDWMILSNLSRPTYINNYYGGGYYDSHHHGKKDDKKDDALAQLILFLLLAGLLLSAFILTFFTLRELIDCGDRIIHNEGTMRAILSMSIMAASGLAGAFIGSVLLAGPLAALAIAAGTSPALVIVLASTALAMIGSGIVGLLFSHFKLQEYFIRKNHPDCIDPAEPQRFSLTDAQERKLSDQGLDIIKVKCAMVAIRNEMNDENIQDKMWRMFTTKGESHQNLLKQLRELKDGKYTQDIDVGGMKFDLRAPIAVNYYAPPQPVEGQYNPPPFVVQPIPSAPPLEDSATILPPPPSYGHTIFDLPPQYQATNGWGNNVNGFAGGEPVTYPNLYEY